MSDLDEGRLVVVRNRKGRVLAAGDDRVRVSLHAGDSTTVAREKVKKWPVMEIEHPLPAGAHVDVLPPEEGTSIRATVKVVGESRDGLAYTVESREEDREFSVGPEAIIGAN